MYKKQIRLVCIKRFNFSKLQKRPRRWQIQYNSINKTIKYYDLNFYYV